MASTFEVRACSDSLLRDDAAGIWKARQSASVSYPEDGNAACFRLEEGSFWFNHRNRCIAEAVGQFPPPGFILDVGGGNGYVAGGLIQAGHETVVLEPGDEGARNARTRNIPHVICATLQDAAFKPASVPAIGLFDVIEHVDDDKGFVAETRRILMPGGLVYVTVPALQWLWAIDDVESGHFRRYSTRELASRFEAEGFEVLYVTYFFELLVAPVYLLRTLPGRLGLRGRRKASIHYEAEHAARVGWLSRMMGRLLEREIRMIASRRALATGTSCLLVARKVR